jgi:hypothetical protein
LGSYHNGTKAAQEHLRRKAFSDALAANEAQMQNPTAVHQDRILFQRGVIFSHPDNPGSNLDLAQESFGRILQDYPDSSRVSETEVIYVLLQRVTRQQKAIETMEAALATKNRQLASKTEKIVALNLQLESASDANTDLLKRFRQLENQLQQLKDVDLGIEAKKRELMPDE